MVFKLQIASEYKPPQKEININNLTDLQNLYYRFNETDLIINFKDKLIIIYDGYLE